LFEKRPTLRGQLETFAWEIWRTLSGYKTATGFGASPVSVTDVVNLCKLNGMDARDVVPLVSSLEGVLRQHAEEKTSSGH
jgi:hypothetical protein